MDRTSEKLAHFSEMVMQESNRQKIDLIKQAEKDKDETISSSEIQYLKKAYEKIQVAVRKIDKGFNEEVSKTIIESKQALFNRRDEIIDAIFLNIRNRLEAFLKDDQYKVLLENLLKRALSEAGEGEIVIVADPLDIKLFEDLKLNLKADYKILESDIAFIGGFQIMNKTHGFIWDYSFMNRLANERKAFLENYKLNIG